MPPLVSEVQPPVMPTFFSHKGEAILSGQTFHAVFVFLSPTGVRYKSITHEEMPIDFNNLVNIIRGGTDGGEIAGLFDTRSDAEQLYKGLKYPTNG